MTNIIKISVFSGLMALAFGIFAFVPAVNGLVGDTIFSPNSASAFTTGYGGTGCAGCGSSSGSTISGNSGGSSYTLAPSQPADPVCKIQLSKSKVGYGGDVVVDWKTKNAKKVTLKSVSGNSFNWGEVPKNNKEFGKHTRTAKNLTKDTKFTLTVKGDNGKTIDCSAKVTVEQPPKAKCDALTASPTKLPYGGGQVTLSWSTSKADSVSISGVGGVGKSGVKVVNVTKDTAFTLTAKGAGGNDTCQVKVTVKPPEDKPAKCDAFSLTPKYLPYGGGDVKLSWATTNAVSVYIDNGVGAVSDDGSKTVHVNKTTTFTLTTKGKGGDDTCYAKVIVKPPVEEKHATCDDFYLNPEQLSDGGGNVKLNWSTTNADSVYINNGVGYVSDDGSETVYVDETTTFTLTAKGADGDDTCTAKIKVDEDEDEDLFCEYLKVSDDEVEEGDEVTLKWKSTGADSAYISPDIGYVDVDGSEEVRVYDDITYTLTVKNGNDKDTCKVSIDVEEDDDKSSKRPTCELDVSDDNIERGDEIELEWDTSHAEDIKIEDNHGNVLLDTDDMDKDEARDWFDGELTVQPREDTSYTLTVEGDGKDRECDVDVEVDDDVMVYEYRDQQPLVSGVYLTQVPYTGFEAGPTLTIIFYGLLTLWALFVAYILIIRRDSILGFSLAGMHDHAIYRDVTTSEVEPLHLSEAEEYVHAATAEPQTLPSVPSNLPTAATAFATNEMIVEGDELSMIENYAHQQQVLLSSDAMRFFVGAVKDGDTLGELDTVIAKAKANFPSEDGWLVLNLSRMESLMADRS